MNCIHSCLVHLRRATLGSIYPPLQLRPSVGPIAGYVVQCCRVHVACFLVTQGFSHVHMLVECLSTPSRMNLVVVSVKP